MKNSEPKLLVVEDSEDLIKSWEVLFARSGFKVRFCTKGRSALAMIDEGFAPDVVMTDYYLPDINGIELIETLRTKSSKSKFLLVTGNRDQNFMELVQRMDDLKVLFKPIQFSALKQEIINLVA